VFIHSFGYSNKDETKLIHFLFKIYHSSNETYYSSHRSKLEWDKVMLII